MQKASSAQLIWKYLDGLCTPDETSRFLILCRENPTFKQEFEYCKQIHASMTGLSPEKAPDSILANTLNAISVRQKYEYKPTAFIFFIAITFALCALVLLLPSSDSALPNALTVLESFHIGFEIDWTIFSKLSSYLTVLLAFPLFAILDHFIESRMAFQKMKHSS